MLCVLRHDYLRRSMVDRIERKSLLSKYKQTEKMKQLQKMVRPTKTSKLRSQSVLESLAGLNSEPPAIRTGSTMSGRNA